MSAPVSCPFPRQAEVFNKAAGESQLGQGPDDQPRPAVGLFGRAQGRRGPTEDAIEYHAQTGRLAVRLLRRPPADPTLRSAWDQECCTSTSARDLNMPPNPETVLFEAPNMGSYQ